MKDVRVYDNGGKTADRYTAVYLSMREGSGLYGARAMNETPFHPQGIGMFVSAALGRHLGKRIAFEALPVDCQKLIRSDLAE